MIWRLGRRTACTSTKSAEDPIPWLQDEDELEQLGAEPYRPPCTHPVNRQEACTMRLHGIEVVLYHHCFDCGVRWTYMVPTQRDYPLALKAMNAARLSEWAGEPRNTSHIRSDILYPGD
jgi:hypothetical protein